MMKKQTLFRILISVTVVLAIFVTPLVLTGQADAARCGGVETSIIPDCPDNGKEINETGVWSLLIIGINVLTALVGVAALAGIIYGIVLYTISEGDSGKVEKSVEVFRNVGIGVVAYALMYIGLNFLVPGGVFG